MFISLDAVAIFGTLIPPTESIATINTKGNAFFSFGKNILNNSTKSLDCLDKLPVEKIGLETDCEISQTQNVKIEDVYKKVFDVKKIKNQENINNFLIQIEHNFDSIFT